MTDRDSRLGKLIHDLKDRISGVDEVVRREAESAEEERREQVLYDSRRTLEFQARLQNERSEAEALMAAMIRESGAAELFSRINQDILGGNARVVVSEIDYSPEEQVKSISRSDIGTISSSEYTTPTGMDTRLVLDSTKNPNFNLSFFLKMRKYIGSNQVIFGGYLEYFGYQGLQRNGSARKVGDRRPEENLVVDWKAEDFYMIGAGIPGYSLYAPQSWGRLIEASKSIKLSDLHPVVEQFTVDSVYRAIKISRGGQVT